MDRGSLFPRELQPYRRLDVGSSVMRITPFSAHFCNVRFYGGDHRFTMAAKDMTSARGFPTLRMLIDVLSAERVIFQAVNDGTCLVQFADKAEYPFRSVAFSRLAGCEEIGLVTDTYFYHSHGYKEIRLAIDARQLPAWRERRSEVYWRGSSTFDFERADGSFVTSVDQIPRVVLCDRLARSVRTNVALSAAWGHGFLGPTLDATLTSKQILKQPTSILREWAGRRFCIDIDGVANAWGFFEKLLVGCCVLKIATPYEQWFYRDLKAWEHYVPVRDDLSDLETRIDWCFANEAAAEDIAHAGQQFALMQTFDLARASNARAIVEGVKPRSET